MIKFYWLIYYVFVVYCVEKKSAFVKQSDQKSLSGAQTMWDELHQDI